MYKRKLPVTINELVALSSKGLDYFCACQAKRRDGWKTCRIAGVLHIIYTSIPEKFRLKWGLPSDEVAEDMVQKIRAAKAAEQQSKADSQAKPQKEVEALYQLIKAGMKDRFHACYNLINQEYNLPPEKVRLFAERWAAWQYLADNYQGNLSHTTAALAMLFPGWLGDKHAVANFSNKFRDKGMAACIDSRAITKAQPRISEFQHIFLRSQYILSNTTKPAAVHAKLVDACAVQGEKPYSLSSVKKYFAEFENNIELFRIRHGQAAAQKRLPFATLLPAEHINTQWQMDGWTLPFWGAQFQRYIVYLVWDNHSRRIVGYSIGKSENTTLILEGLEDAMRTTGYLPAELVSDKHSWHKTAINARLREETERMGMVWTVTINAQRNQLAERRTQYLDARCQDYKGYLGKNITAKGNSARPSPEALEELAKSKNWLTEEEIKAIAVCIIADYNKAALPSLAGLSPNEKYAQSSSAKAFAVSEEERVKLVRPVSAYTVKRGQITIMVGRAKHEFQLSADLIDRYNNKPLEVAYEDLSQGIYIYDPKTGEALGSVDPKPKIPGAVADQTEEHKHRFNQQTGRKNGTIAKARKAAHADIAEGLKENPEAIALVNSYGLPKDIRQEAQQSTEVRARLRDMGISEALLPIREQEVPAVLEPITTGGKTKESPFAKPGNQIRRMTMEEQYGFTDQ